MKSLTRFIIFHQKHLLPPRLVKTKATANKAVEADESLKYKIYDDEVEAKQAFEKMTIQHQKKMKQKIKEEKKTSVVEVKQKTEQEMRQDAKKLENINEWREKWKSWKLSGQQLQRKVKNQRKLIRETGKISQQQIKQKSQEFKKVNRFIDITRLMDTSKDLYEGFVPSPISQKNVDSVDLYFDGCSKGNPGESGIGYVAKTNKGILFSNSLYIGHYTNNEAQWIAFMWGLTDCVLKQIPRVQVYGDSNLVIQTMRRAWKLAKPQLMRYEARCRELQQHFSWLGFNHIGRQKNKQADQLANMSLKTHQKIKK